MAYVANSQHERTFFAFSAIAEGLKSINYQMKHARMMSVLSAMSDQRLEALGIKRSEIPAHAAKLISK